MSASEFSDDDNGAELPAEGEPETKKDKKVKHGRLWNGVFCTTGESDSNENPKNDSNAAPNESIILLNAIEERKWGSVMKWKVVSPDRSCLNIRCSWNY